MGMLARQMAFICALANVARLAGGSSQRHLAPVTEANTAWTTTRRAGNKSHVQTARGRSLQHMPLRIRNEVGPPAP
jgi:hypothetical protein